MHHHDFSGEPCGSGVRGHHPAGHGPKMPFGGMGGMHHGFGGPHGSRARRGDVRPAILRLLSEQPMHGYQIIQELSARSDGAWTPSAGSVYPVLQLLADEGLVTAEETGGKKIFSLTEAGTATVAETAGQPAPWEEIAQGNPGAADYRASVGKFMAAVFQVGKNGTKAQTEAALVVLDEARKKLYSILAEG
jgi:DNA-binding PadR family transcriptional regulator